MDTDIPLGQQRGVTLPVAADPSGEHGPRRRDAAGPEWRRSSHGLYVPAYVEPTPMQRVAEAGVLLPSRGAVTGWGALAWRFGWWFSGMDTGGTTPRPVQVAVSFHRIRDQPLLIKCEERFDPHEVEEVDGLRVTTCARSVCFEMRYAPDLEAAVRALDLAAFHDLASVDEARAWARRHPSYTGIEQCRQAVDLGDENAWSPTEVDMRLDWKRLLPTATILTNRPVFDASGRHIGTPDLIDPVNGVVGEYDGALHLEGGRRSGDLRRQHRFREHGLETVVMVSADLRDRGPYHARLRAAYARAARIPDSERTWTLQRPAWWPATFTVEQRRALTDRQRQKWLAHRAG